MQSHKATNIMITTILKCIHAIGFTHSSANNWPKRVSFCSEARNLHSLALKAHQKLQKQYPTIKDISIMVKHHRRRDDTQQNAQ